MTLTSRRLRAFLSAVAVVALTAGLLVAYGQFRSEPDQPGIEARGPKTTQPPAAAATPTATPDADAGEAGGESAEELNEEAAGAGRGHREAPRGVREGQGRRQDRPAATHGGRGGRPGCRLGRRVPDGHPVGRLGAGDRRRPATPPFVYVLATRYAAPKPCPGNCPSPWMAVEVSPDGGVTWGNPTPLCACKGSGQFDPIIEVVPSNGNVYALYMNGFNVMFTKSTDHGATWSAPVKTYGNVSWNDKPVIAMSDNGQHVFVSFNGPTGGDPYVAQSHDSGATWTQTKLVDSNRYYFAFDADVAPNGTVYFAESSILYGGGGNKGTVPTGAIDYHAFVSTNNGATLDRPPRRLRPARVSPATRPAVRRTSTSATRRCRSTAPTTSCTSTTGRRRSAASRPSSRSGRRTAARRGARRSRCRSPARTR